MATCTLIFFLSQFFFSLILLGWVHMNTSGDTSLPCLICIAQDGGHGKDYRNVDLTPAMLHTHLQPRLRQHFKRKHGIGTRHQEAESLRTRAKQLVCRRLHAEVQKLDDPPPFVPLVGFLIVSPFTVLPWCNLSSQGIFHDFFSSLRLPMMNQSNFLPH